MHKNMNAIKMWKVLVWIMALIHLFVSNCTQGKDLWKFSFFLWFVVILLANNYERKELLKSGHTKMDKEMKLNTAAYFLIFILFVL